MDGFESCDLMPQINLTLCYLYVTFLSTFLGSKWPTRICLLQGHVLVYQLVGFYQLFHELLHGFIELILSGIQSSIIMFQLQLSLVSGFNFYTTKSTSVQELTRRVRGGIRYELGFAMGGDRLLIVIDIFLCG